MRVRRLSLMLMISGLLAHTGCVTTGALNSNDLPPLEAGTPSKVELTPTKSAQLHLALAESLEKNLRDAEAADAYEKARLADPHLPNVSRRLAGVYDRLGNNQRALEEYHLALKAAPRDANLINRFGYYYYTRGQWKDAEAQFRQALAIDPNLQRARINLGLTLGQQQQYDPSLAEFTKVLSKAEAYSNLAFVLTTQGKKEEAKQTYREALRIDSNLQIARLALQKLEAPPAPVRTTGSVTTPASAPSTPLPDQGTIFVGEATSRGQAPPPAAGRRSE